MTAEYEILRLDPYLHPYKAAIDFRMKQLEKTKKQLLHTQKSLSAFANGYLYFGFQPIENGWCFREWAPNAKSVYLIGDFNDWNRQSHPLAQIGEGIWELKATGSLPHGSKVRLLIDIGYEQLERIPSYSKRAVQNPETFSFDGQIWCPPSPYKWVSKKHPRITAEPLLIYESHVGMSGEEPKVSRYSEFTDFVLPRVKELGYNAIQLMAIQEHPYYASFGYQVSSFFAVSSRFGTPEDLKRLIDTAHKMGISVLLDIVHSHAAGNEVEGLARFDGTAYQYFHDGAKGTHPQWGTKLFDYGKPQVLHFLLSNIKFWLEEYRFDGFRFDGVTSMLYHDHGLCGPFNNYDKYFGNNTDNDAVTYLQLATSLCKELNPHSVLIAEDMSGMPGMCIPVEEGGIGFDYRLAMGMPDYWINTLHNLPDEQWNMGHLWHELTQRRPKEKVIGYCESHDQALVGDKTIMFRLADKEMYWQMDKNSSSPIIGRAVALHKMMRLITCACAGEGYLNFMGNEFGHPEWIDFPREGNGNSYHYARRQWSLADSESLRYGDLQAFDKAMISLVRQSQIYAASPALLLHNEEEKVLVFTRGNCLFAFNFHPANDARIALPFPKGWHLQKALDTNWCCFGAPPSSENPPAEYTEGILHFPLYRRSAEVWHMITTRV